MTRIQPIDNRLLLSVAPMMKYTDTHCRYFHRLLSPSVRLYTEMVTTPAIINGNRQKLMSFNAEEHPIALQLGGSDPQQLAECTVIAEDLGFDEVNLNCGCPSDRVQDGHFGACLMLSPDKVAESVDAMRSKTSIPITVKCRIGVDDVDSYDALVNFATKVINAGCDTLIVHARKAHLQGLNPKQNRTVPPLNYPFVYQLKELFPSIPIVINGGIETIEAINEHLNHVDGVMIGRQAYHHPRSLIDFDKSLYKNKSQDPTTLTELIDVYQQYMEYAYKILGDGHPKLSLMSMARHSINLFEGLKGSRLFRQTVSENAYKAYNATDARLVTEKALQALLDNNS